MAGFNNYGYGYGYNNYPNPTQGFYQNGLQQNQFYQGQNQQPVSDGLIYVHGIEGANAFQLPPNVNRVILWDDTEDQYYVKGYDNMGKPRVLAWNDVFPHKVEEKPANQNSSYEDMSKYVTKDYLESIISELSVGERGRIVRSNEHDA